MKYKFNFAYVSIVLYIFIVAFSLNTLNYVSGSVPESLSLVVGVTASIIFFHWINYKKLIKMYTLIMSNLRSFITLNILVVLFWGLPYFGASRHADIMIISFNCAVSLCAMLAATSYKKNKMEVFSFICILIISIIIFIISICTNKEIISPASGFLGGACAFYYMQVSKNLNEQLKLSPTQILAVRGYILLIFSIIMLRTNHNQWHLTLMAGICLTIITLFSFIIPNYLLQTAVEKLGPVKPSLLMNSIPIITTLISFFFFTRLNWLILGCSIIYFILNLRTLFFFLLHDKLSCISVLQLIM